MAELLSSQATKFIKDSIYEQMLHTLSIYVCVRCGGTGIMPDTKSVICFLCSEYNRRYRTTHLLELVDKLFVLTTIAADFHNGKILPIYKKPYRERFK